MSEVMRLPSLAGDRPMRNRSALLRAFVVAAVLLGTAALQAASIGASSSPQAAVGESASLLNRIDAFRTPYKEFLVRVRLTSRIGARIDETALFDAYISGPEKSLIVAREHANKGMKLLYIREDMWIHLPDTRRPLRITPMQRLMGEASNGDIARVSLTEDYTAVDQGPAVEEATDCRKILLTAARESAPYARIILYVRASDFRSVKAEFYLPSGKRYKTARYEEYKPLEGRMVLTRMTIEDDLQRDRTTTMEYLAFEKKTIPARYFNKNGLVDLNILQP